MHLLGLACPTNLMMGTPPHTHSLFLPGEKLIFVLIFLCDSHFNF